jgi:hypothetical protein
MTADALLPAVVSARAVLVSARAVLVSARAARLSPVEEAT